MAQTSHQVAAPGNFFKGAFDTIRQVLPYRELLGNLVRKELKVRYKNSALGFLWSMLNPAMYLVIFYIVFTKFLGTVIPNFAIYLLSGLLGWNLLASSLSGAAGSIVGNASLVTKVYFPRAILPLAAVGASLVHFCLQFVVLLGGLAVFRFAVDPARIILIPSALIVELLFLGGLGLLVASLNVYFRDVQHFLELALLAWFWMTPIVYPIAFVQQHVGGTLLWKLYRLNPATSIVMAFQRGIYGHAAPVDSAGITHEVLIEAPLTWYLSNLAWVAVASLVVIVVALGIFYRLESRLAEEL